MMRQALAGMLWTKQYYYFDLDRWLSEHGDLASSRNRHWRHMVNDDILSMPDKWEYPWYAAWDLAFHTVALSMVDRQTLSRCPAAPARVHREASAAAAAGTRPELPRPVPARRVQHGHVWRQLQLARAVWLPVNLLIVRALLQLYLYYGDSFRVECPTGSGRWCSRFE